MKHCRKTELLASSACKRATWLERRLSRPTWKMLVYSAEDPPAHRGLVLVDAVDGTIVEYYVEENPEECPKQRSRGASETNLDADGTS